MEWNCQIESIGVKSPGRRLTTSELTGKFKIPFIKKFSLLTGISERKICSAGEDSFSLAEEAARNCLSHSKSGLIIGVVIFRMNGIVYRYGSTN